MGYRRQGRPRSPPWLGPRSTQFQGPPDRRAGRARARSALPSAFLATLTGKGANRGVRSVLVWPCAGGARRGLRKRAGHGPVIILPPVFLCHPWVTVTELRGDERPWYGRPRADRSSRFEAT